MGVVTNYLGVKFTREYDNDNKLNLNLSQSAFAEQLISDQNLQQANSVDTQYKPGRPIDSIPRSTLDPNSNSIVTPMRYILGSLL